MRNILDLVTATHWTSRHVCLSQRKSLRNEQIGARTVASRCEKRTSGPRRLLLGRSRIEAGDRGHAALVEWRPGRDRATAGPGGLQPGKVRNGHRADHCGAAGRQGPQVGRPWAGLHHHHRDRLRRAGLQHRRDAGVRGRLRRAAVAGRRRPRVRAHAVLLDRLQRAEQGGSRLRHHVHVGDARVRPENGMGGRLGDHRRRRPGHGEPGPGRRPVRVPAVQRQGHRVGPDQRLGAAGRCAVDRGDDLHLLPGDRGLRQLPEGRCWASSW